MFNSQNSFTISIILFVLGAVTALIFQKKDSLANFFGNTFAIGGSIFGIISAVRAISYNDIFAKNFSTTLPNLSFSIKMDHLSAFFVFVISLIALMASIYGIGYIKHYYSKYNLGTLGFCYNAFIAGMILVVTAHNALFFLIVWEIMSLASYFLVIYEKDKTENVRAGSLYFAMTHIGTAFIILAFLLLYKSVGSFDFDVIKNGMTTISSLTKNMIFVLAFIGFGTKAGLIPFHIWLPSAHPAAPSHVSALMSGVMIKTGIYMFIRLFLDIMPHPPIWWGIFLLIIGAISSLLGVLYALSEHDIKKLLAFHSIENIGIILLGLGSTLIFTSLGLTSLATLSLIATLFHTLNHAIFKALLFMGAGSVIQQTHTRNIEEYGGLIKYMPYTALLFLVGSMAISALPPFNGFASEWLTFQSLFAGIRSTNAVAQWPFILAASALAITGGLAAACFVKVFGVTFLARPRSEEVKHAKESAFSLNLGMTVLALLTLILGVFSSPVSKVLSKISNSIITLNTSTITETMQSSSIRTPDNFASVSMPSVFLALLLLTALVLIVVNFVSRKQKVRLSETWDCGTTLTPRMEITATGFSRSIISIFKNILRPTREVETEFYHPEGEYFLKGSTVNLGIKDIYKTYLYSPFQRLIIAISELAKKIQSGNVNVYILYIFIALAFLLMTGVIR